MASCANRPSYKEETIELTIEKWVFAYGKNRIEKVYIKLPKPAEEEN